MTSRLVQDSATWPVGLRAAGAARRVVRDACLAAGVEAAAGDKAVLLTSELVGNATIHGRSAVRLTVMITDNRLRVEVNDDNPDHPVIRHMDPDAVNGRGVALVEAYSTRWGVVGEEIGKTVWFELDLASPRADR